MPSSRGRCCISGATGAAVLFAAGCAGAQDAEDRYDGDRFAVETVQVAEDIYLFHRPVVDRYPVQGNAVAIVNDRDVVMVDGGGLPANGEHVIAALKAITDKPVSVIVTTHWHQDHNWAHQVYRDAYPGVQVIAHAFTWDALIDNPYLTQLRETPLEERIQEYEANWGEQIQELVDAGDPDFRIARARDIRDSFAVVEPEHDRATKGLPDITIEDSITLRRGDRRIEVLFLGRANTDGDLIVWVPDRKVVATGDMVVAPTPYGYGSHPAEWAETLRAVNALGYDVLIPGHGLPQRDTAYVDLLIELMEAIVTRVQAAVDAGAEDVDAVREAVDLSDFDDRFAKGDPLLADRFDVWFKQPIVGGAYGDLVSAEETE